MACKECSLYKDRTNPVFGEGSPNAEILFIGEAPGASEDIQGRPFCGKSGKVLDELLEEAGIKREDVYITNILKCRPPGNRNPLSKEISSCSCYLDEQIAVIKPKIICCLGNFASAYIMKKFGLEAKVQGIGKIHGRVFFSKSGYGRIKIIPLYHPSALLYNRNMKGIITKDFNMLRNMPK